MGDVKHTKSDLFLRGQLLVHLVGVGLLCKRGKSKLLDYVADVALVRLLDLGLHLNI